MAIFITFIQGNFMTFTSDATFLSVQNNSKYIWFIKENVRLQENLETPLK